MWRDVRLTRWHGEHGVPYPAAGMSLPFIEYDGARPVGLVSYHPVTGALPTGGLAVTAHGALSSLQGDLGALPFITVLYDLSPGQAPLYHLNAHNEAGARLVSGAWRQVGEVGLATVLYAMRNRSLPDLTRYGLALGEPSQLAGEPFPGAAMSVRRRNFEPVDHVPARMRIPCTDIDLMVPLAGGKGLGLVVDYKLHTVGGEADLNSASLRAMAELRNADGSHVPAMVAAYDPFRWTFLVTCLNAAADRHLCYVLGGMDVDPDRLARAIAGEPVLLNEAEWLRVLAEAGR